MDLWIKALHIIAVISWMAALLYLPRLMVYHCQLIAEKKDHQIFKTMEARLLNIIAKPAMIITWLTGLYLLFSLYLNDLPWWLVVKLMMVVILSGFHFFLSYQVRLFRQDANKRRQIFFRLINELPTLLMIIIVIMVIIKPW